MTTHVLSANQKQSINGLRGNVGSFGFPSRLLARNNFWFARHSLTFMGRRTVPSLQEKRAKLSFLHHLKRRTWRRIVQDKMIRIN